MTKETLRMQFLSGVITEGEYKAKLEEGKDLEKAIKTFEDKIKTFEKELENAKKKIAKEKSKKNPNQETIERYLEDVEFVTDELKKDRQALKSYQKELKSKKESLNEHYVAGGIVGIGAITQIPSREKTDYEMAFEHFLGERYLNKFENREQDPYSMKEGKEDLNENNIDQLKSGIKGAFDAVRSLPLPSNAKLEMAKIGVGFGTLKALTQKLEANQKASPEGKARLEKAMATIKQATSIEEIEQALIDALDNYASTRIKEVEEPSLYEEELKENIFQGEDVMPKFRAGVLKQLIAYAEKEGSSKESIDDLKAALAKIEAEIEAEKNKKPLPR